MRLLRLVDATLGEHHVYHVNVDDIVLIEAEETSRAEGRCTVWIAGGVKIIVAEYAKVIDTLIANGVTVLTLAPAD